MMQPCASGGESSKAVGPFFRAASRAKGQVGTPPPRTVIGGSSREADGHRNCLRLLLLISSPHDAERRTIPCGTSPVARNRHSAMSSLRASATTMVLRFLPAATLA